MRGNAKIVVRGGFTLIELMVAILILSIVVSLVYMTFSTVASSTADARTLNAELQLGTFLRRNLVENLTQAYDPWLPGAALRFSSRSADVEDVAGSDSRYWFVGEDIEGPNGPADTLVFASSAPLLGASGLPGFLKQVSYRISDEPVEDADYVPEVSALSTRSKLLLVETAIEGAVGASDAGLSGSLDFGSDAVDMPDADPAWNTPIRCMNIRYFDGEDWVDHWNSSGEGRLPWSVEFRITFARTEEELEAERFDDFSPIDDPDLLLVVSLPGGAGVYDAPPAYSVVEGGS